MRTGIFHFLKRKGKTEDSAAPFSPLVFAALDEAKGKEGEAFEAVVSKVFDSVGGLKDCEQKEKLANMVRDAFENPTEALANKEELSKVLDSVYTNVSLSSIGDVTEAMKATTKVVDSEVTDEKDSDGKGKNTNNVADSKDTDGTGDTDGTDGTEDEKKKDKKESIEKTKETPSKDSVVLTKEDIVSIVRTEVQSALGITTTKDSITGVELTSTKDSVGDVSDALDVVFG